LSLVYNFSAADAQSRFNLMIEPHTQSKEPEGLHVEIIRETGNF